MGLDPRNSANGGTNEYSDTRKFPRLDPETVKRTEYALEGTIHIDVSALSPDDKLMLLIERYNRKTRELQQLRNDEEQY